MGRAAVLRGASSDAPFGLDEWKQISELEDADEDRHTRHGIRRAYFSVADLDQRKALIEGERNPLRLAGNSPRRRFRGGGQACGREGFCHASRRRCWQRVVSFPRIAAGRDDGADCDGLRGL